VAATRPDIHSARTGGVTLDHVLTVHDELGALVRSHAFPGPEALARWADLLAIDLKTEADRWLTEERAKLRSGKSIRWLRERFKVWAEEGYAKMERGGRFYYVPAIPRRMATSVTTDDPREQARRDAA
jgi:hypothetical protein